MNRTRLKYYLAAFVAVITFIVYLPVLQNEFVNWDDGVYVFNNPHIRSLDAAFFKWAFFESRAILWHPLTWISHAADYAVWGLNPAGHHFSSALIHGLNAMLVVLFAAGLVEAWGATHRGGESEGPFALRRQLTVGVMTGLLFGLHPLHVESVAWVTERKDVLYSFFFLLSLLSYLRYARTADEGETGVFRDRRYLSALGFFALALLSKPMAVTLPAVLLLLDWYPLGRLGNRTGLKKVILEKVPFFALSVLVALIAAIPGDFKTFSTTMEVRPFSTRVLVGAGALISYLGKMVWPHHLVPLYPYPYRVSLSSPAYFLPLGSVLAITVGCAFLARTRKLWPAVWAFYVITLLPVLGLIPFGPHAMADRYTYLPSLGPFLILALGGAWVSEKAQAAESRALLMKVLIAGAACALLLSLSALTVRQTGIWKNSLSLWDFVIEKEPGSALAHNNRGIAYKERGRFDKAIEDYDAAVTVKQPYLDAYYNRGLAYEGLGRIDKAIEDYERAISLDPANYQAYNNRGILFGSSGSFDQAIEYFSRAIAIKPDYPDPYFNRGFTYSLMGRYDRALEDFNRAIALNQYFAAAYFNRGKVYLKTGRKEAGLWDFRMACELGDKEACGN